MNGPARLTKENTQGRLLKLAALFLLLFALILTLSPAARLRTWAVDYRLGHWVGLLAWGVVAFIAYQQLKRHSPESDPLLFPLAALLSGWGMLSIWRLSTRFGLRQSIWLLVGAGFFITGLRLPSVLSALRRYKYIWLFSGLALTALTLLFGTNPLGYGPRLWLGCCGIYLQPSEPLKLLLVIYLAAYLADRQPLMPSLLSLLIPTAFMAGLVLLLLVVQRDLGTASIFVFIYTAIIYAATGVRRLPLLAGGILAFAGFAGYWLFDLIRLRVDAWLNPWLDPSGRSYQIVQSLIAVASGGMLGRGPGLGSPSLVPIAHSDFIFSTIAEETGLVGTIALLSLLALLVTRTLRLALRAENHYYRYLAVGLSAYLGGQSILIIGGTIRLLPLTGVTLPFVSYGGSSLVTSFLALLLLVQISCQGERLKLPPQDQKPVLHLAALLLAGFAAAALVNGWWAYARGPALQTRTDNARRAIADRYVPRGSLLTNDGTPLTITTGAPGSYRRVYLAPSFGPILGYTHPVYGQVGLEAALDPILRGLEFQSPWRIWRDHLLYGQPPPGSDIRLTLDLSLQTAAQQALGDTPGAALLLNADTGEILVMASAPAFDPNTLDENWLSLIEDPAAPLLNRATLGQYQPGPALGPLLLAAFGQPGDLPPPLTSDPLPFPEFTLACIQTPDDPTWEAAISQGCPLPVAALGEQAGSEALLTLFQTLGFYSPPAIRLETTAQTPPALIAAPGTAAVGQGDLRLSPLQLALAAAALSGHGTISAPQIALAAENPAGDSFPLPTLEEPVQALPARAADQTASALAVPGLPLWQSLALAYNNPNQPLTWYLGGTLPDAETSLVVVVLLEEENPYLARTIGLSLLLEAIEGGK